MGIPNQNAVNVYEASVVSGEGIVRTTVKLPRNAKPNDLYALANVLACIALGCRHDEPTLRVRYSITRNEPN